MAHLHGQVGDVRRLRHAGHAEQPAIQVVADAGRFGIRALGVLLHHPDVGAAVGQQYPRVIDHAAIDAGHGQRGADQQAETDPGEDELAPGMQDVAAGEADHDAVMIGRTP
jgi:hypothetical protein